MTSKAERQRHTGELQPVPRAFLPCRARGKKLDWCLEWRSLNPEPTASWPAQTRKSKLQLAAFAETEGGCMLVA